MSSTFSELAATSLISALAAQPESDRFLIAGVPGEDLADTFRAVLARAEGTRGFSSGPGAPSAELRVLESADGAVIVPYLVQDPPPKKLRENRGSQGYASALRDHYDDVAGDGERIMLLVFDDRPNETLTTTMNQALGESALGLEQLLGLALLTPEGSPQALVRVAAELRAVAAKQLRETLAADTVGRAAQAVGELAQRTTSDEVGAALHKLPWCLSDPGLFEHAGSAFRARLRNGMRHRQRLEAWARDPSADFDAEVRNAYGPEAAAMIVSARTGPVIDWAEFTLEDLLTGEPLPPDDELPAFTDLPVSIPEASSWKVLNGGRTLAAQIPGPGCTLRFSLTRALAGKATIHVLGPDGAAPPFSAKPVAKVTAEDGGEENPAVVISGLPQPRPGWSFLEVMLTKGSRLVKKPLASITLAIMVSPKGEPLVYEADGAVDFPAQAYTAEEQLTIIGEHDGEQLFAEPLEPPEPEFGELVTVSSGVAVPTVQGDSGEDPADQPPTESPEHLALEAWASQTLPPGELRTSLRERPGGVIVADIGPVARPMGTSAALPGSRWKFERYVIEHPESTCFRVDAAGNPIADHQLQHALGALHEPFEAFLEIRGAFLAELAEFQVPSVLAADLTQTSAQEYVDTYQALLEAIPDDEPGQLGYDRVVLTDAFLSDTGEILIAPTSPLSVALHLKLQSKVRAWVASEPADNFFAGDSALISAQYLVPYLRLHTIAGKWLESGYAPYPWRRYLPLTEQARQERHPWLSRYIARRIERFLDVHPSYADERRTIRLAFINPGPASHVRDALLHLVSVYLKRRGGDGLRELPAFELQLLSDDQQADGVLGSGLDVFMGFVPEEGQPTEEAMEVMKRLSYTKGRTAEFLQDPKSFAHITLVEDFFRPRAELFEWPADKHPTSFYAGGLAADSERLATDEPAATRFLSAAWTGGQPTGSPGAIAVRTSEIVAAATGVPVKRGIVRAADVLVPDSQIPQLYDRAVWVVHVDRNVGLELFAPQDEAGGAPYILDYTDQETPEPGIFDGITATSQVGPYRALVADALGTAVYQPVPQPAAERLLRTLNLISGRWGLEMLRTSDNVLRGRLATALAAQVLEQSEALHGDPKTLSLVIALDELLRVTGGEGLPLKTGWAAKMGVTGGGSDDLLILTVPLDSGRPKLSGRIVEVKYRSGAGTSAEEAAKQLRQTHDILTRLLVDDSQPGRSFQGRHLAKLVLRYASRHVAYGIVSGHPVVSAGTEALSRIAAGDYDLDLTVRRGGKELCGDYVSVEPDLADAALTPHAANAGGTEIGRIRIGAPVIAAMLQGGQLPAAAGAPSQGHVHAPEPPRSAAGPAAAAPEPDAEPAPELPAPSPVSAPDLGAANTPAPEASPGEVTERAAADLVAASGESGERGSAAGEPAPAPPASAAQSPIAAVERRFELPPEQLRSLGGRLDDVLMSFNLPLQPVQPGDAVCGPNTIRFRVRMARGGTIAQVEARERDVMRELGLEKSLMVGQDAGFVTLDIPRADPVTVTFGDLASELTERPRAHGDLPVLFGVDLAGRPRIEDLTLLPHLLVAGSTNSGKSVFLASLLASLALLPPEQVQIVLIDVKGLDFAPFAALPHLRQPPIGSAEKALECLDELYAHERAARHETLAASGAQSILDYYKRLGGTELSQIVIVIDEFSNLLGGDKATGSQLEDTIQLYAEIMRSFGIYLVIATQRPSADIVTGRIKANLPARCAFRLPTHSDSMTILGRKGAEQLLGKGDMLFYRDGAIERLQAPLTVPQDVLGAAPAS